MNCILSSKIKTTTLVLLFVSCLLTSGNAHELWVTALGYEDGLVRSNIGYGHDFPRCEPIAADRLHIFEPLRLVTAEGTITLDQVGANYAYKKKVALDKGSYLVLATYRPTFWSNGPEGWAQTDRRQRPNATYVEEAIMCGKTVFNVKGAMGETLVTRPVGQRLEIVPLINPGRVEAGEKLPVQVLYDGKPVAGLVVSATFDRRADDAPPAFKEKTNPEGKVEIAPLESGYWMVKARHVLDHPDKSRADEIVLLSTLTFRIGE